MLTNSLVLERSFSILLGLVFSVFAACIVLHCTSCRVCRMFVPCAMLVSWLSESTLITKTSSSFLLFRLVYPGCLCPGMAWGLCGFCSPWPFPCWAVLLQMLGSFFPILYCLESLNCQVSSPVLHQISCRDFVGLEIQKKHCVSFTIFYCYTFQALAHFLALPKGQSLQLNSHKCHTVPNLYVDSFQSFSEVLLHPLAQ